MLFSTVLALAATLLAGASARADDTTATATGALLSISALEKSAPKGRLTVGVQERRGAYKEGETAADIAKRLSVEKPLLADGTFLFGPDGWRKELVFPATEERRALTRTTTSEMSGVLRFLVQVTAGSMEQKRAQVAHTPVTSPGDAVLSRHVARSLAGVIWDTATADGPLLTLKGARGGEKHTLILSRSAAEPPVFQLKHWDLSRPLPGPGNDRRIQTYSVEVTAGPEAGSITRLEEWMVNPPPASNVAYRVTEVKKTEALPSLKPEDLGIRFPKGTIVTDNRGEVPVEYQQTEEGVTDDDVARAAADLARERVDVGQPAPAFDFVDLRGKSIRLADFSGKVVVLFWFSTQSASADQTATFVRELAENYRKKGVKFVALNVAEEGDASRKAEEFEKKAKWDFPVAVDLSSAAMRKYGLEAGVPKIAIIDRKGILSYVRAGLDPDAITAELERVTKDAPKK